MSIENEELNSLLTTIRNQAREIETLQKELNTQRKNAEQYNIEHALREKAADKPADKAEKPKAKATRKKAEAKK